MFLPINNRLCTQLSTLVMRILLLSSWTAARGKSMSRHTKILHSAGIGTPSEFWSVTEILDQSGFRGPRSCGVVVVVLPWLRRISLGRAFRQMPNFTYCLWCCCRPFDRYLSKRGDRFDYVEYMPLYQVNTLYWMVSIYGIIYVINRWIIETTFFSIIPFLYLI